MKTAIEFVDQFATYDTYEAVRDSKKFALIAIEEILGMVDEDSLYFDYWIEVKEEILKM